MKSVRPIQLAQPPVLGHPTHARAGYGTILSLSFVASLAAYSYSVADVTPALTAGGGAIGISATCILLRHGGRWIVSRVKQFIRTVVAGED